MAFTPITGIVSQFSNLANDLAVDYYLKLYDAGTTTPYSMATDSVGATRLAKCKISAEGYPVTNPADDTTVFVPHVDQNYRIVLYRNETDADNNTTANAAWNVDNLLPDATVAADISQITTRGTTLQAQDDYDRSPLFVDATDFTAGLGPHVITMPVQVPAWAPNSTGFRFYKLSTAGAITTPTVTSSDATTFTISDTLLSTDTLFVGDEEFRNENSGDPDDIKARLGLSDALLAANNLSDVASAATSRTNLDVYSKSEGDARYVRGDNRTTIFTGSVASYDLDSAAGGHPGDGFYLITDSVSTSASIYIVAGQRCGTAYEPSDVGAVLQVISLEVSAANVITLEAITSTSSAFRNITKIEKIG